MSAPWHPFSFRALPSAQPIDYPDDGRLEGVVQRLGELPPLVTSWEIERLRGHLADAQQGRRFVLQGGDCAETLADCTPRIISAKMKILLQMSLVLVHGTMKPVVRVGRMAGQYAKPRSQATERRDGQELPNYFGDLFNRAPFTRQDRTFDPDLMLACYQHAASTLNFVRSLTAAGFADLHHPEQWDLAFLQNAELPPELRAEYQRSSQDLARALRFMEALGEVAVDELTRVEFYTCHEGLNLHYEAAQTRTVPRRAGHYLLSTHLPWIGERTRQLDHAHVEFFRGIRNPVGVKVGPSARPDDLRRLADALNPEDEPGKLVFITRMGAAGAATLLPDLLRRTADGRRILWIVDPMHGNTHVAEGGYKTRSFGDIQRELLDTLDAHEAAGTVLGGVHFELTGDDVTECTGGAAGVTVEDLGNHYTTACDPRLNYRQALEMAFVLSRRLRGG